MRFEEKVLFKTRQHVIIPVSRSLASVLFVSFPLAVLAYLLSGYSIGWASFIFFFMGLGTSGYFFYLWYHSWLMVGNQKITMAIRNGLFSQYAMNIRYRNIRDCAVSKSNIWSFLFRYGTLFIRSSGAEWDFEARFVPKVGKIYAIINALSRYTDDERSDIADIGSLHTHHTKQEFSGKHEDADRHG